MTVLVASIVLAVLESTLPFFCLSYKMQYKEATVTVLMVLAVSAVMAVSVMTATPLKLNPPFPTAGGLWHFWRVCSGVAGSLDACAQWFAVREALSVKMSHVFYSQQGGQVCCIGVRDGPNTTTTIMFQKHLHLMSQQNSTWWHIRWKVFLFSLCPLGWRGIWCGIWEYSKNKKWDPARWTRKWSWSCLGRPLWCVPEHCFGSFRCP